MSNSTFNIFNIYLLTKTTWNHQPDSFQDSINSIYKKNPISSIKKNSNLYNALQAYLESPFVIANSLTINNKYAPKDLSILLNLNLLKVYLYNKHIYNFLQHICKLFNKQNLVFHIGWKKWILFKKELNNNKLNKIKEFVKK